MNFERLALACLGIAFTIPGSASIWRRRALSRSEASEVEPVRRTPTPPSRFLWQGGASRLFRALARSTDCPAHSWNWCGNGRAGFGDHTGRAVRAPCAYQESGTIPSDKCAGVPGRDRLNIFGFVVSAQVAVRFVWGGLGWMESHPAIMISWHRKSWRTTAFEAGSHDSFPTRSGYEPVPKATALAKFASR